MSRHASLRNLRPPGCGHFDTLAASRIEEQVGALRSAWRELHLPATQVAVEEAHLDAFVRRLVQGKVGLESLPGAQPQWPIDKQHAHLIGLIAGAIKHVERLWQQEWLDLSDVTFAFWSLRTMLITLDLQAGPWPPSAQAGAACIATVPGALHSYGPSLVARQLKRLGWRVKLLHGADGADIGEQVRSYPFEVVGLSAGQDADLLGLAELIESIRDLAAHRGIRVMVGGNVFSAPAVQYQFLGADLVAIGMEEGLDFISQLTRDGPRQ